MFNSLWDEERYGSNPKCSAVCVGLMERSLRCVQYVKSTSFPEIAVSWVVYKWGGTVKGALVTMSVTS